MRLILDIEANGLLGPGLNYLKLPFRLKSTYRIWCAVIRNVETNAVQYLTPDNLTRDNLKKLLDGCTELIGHNIVNYDLPTLMLAGLVDYRIGYPGEPSTLYGNPVQITDTLVWSRLLNADRLNGHSLEAWGIRLKNHKGNFDKWDEYSQEMLDYCIQDTNTNRAILGALEKEKGEHNWNRAYDMEVKLVDLTLKQELFGFSFDQQLAEKNLADLTAKMQVIAAKVDPLLPPKRLTKGKISEFTPPKKQINKDGSVSALMTKFMQKHGMEFKEWLGEAVYKGKTYTLPFTEPLETMEPASIEDIDVVKGYLMSLGWEPTEITERDLCKRADKRPKTPAEVQETIERYVEQTENSVFKNIRLDILETTMEDLEYVLRRRVNGTKPLYVPTGPKITIGLEKEICPNLVALGDKAEFVKDVVQYYTYRHRRNSIAGGELDEDGEPITGFLSSIREDGRIPTPANTLGANTGRYRHRIVVNVPRNTSLYGLEMRSMFGAGEVEGQTLWQLGYDFASLEARIMGHYVIGPPNKPYTDGMELAVALLATKPNDIHSINAGKLGIKRDQAKSFSYAAIYGAQPKKLAKMLGVSLEEGQRLFNEYWDAVIALKELKQAVERQWNRSGKKTIPGLDGRLLNTRSQHSLINVLFQSGGAISAKWSAVRLAQAMEREGILGDPFVHEIHEPKCWWLIHMHDEQQMAVHPSLMKVKNYKTEEEAKAARIDSSGAIGHGSKGYYVTDRTLPIQCIAEGIQRAQEELGLRVELGFEYIAGKNWGQCH